MKGFSSRTSVDDALAWIDSVSTPFERLATETVKLNDAASRILADEIISPVNVPGFDRSMMDGYALLSEQSYGATAYNALPLQIIGSSLPGRPYPGTVTPGTAVRIMTGAPMPDGADAVLPAEYATMQEHTVHVMAEVSAGKHVGTTGEDIRCGGTVLLRGRLLRPQDVGVLSSIGCAQVPVIRRPTVHILITGNELLPAGSCPQGYQIADSNGPMLQALVSRDGGIPKLSGIIPDDRESLLAALQQPADIVLISGGSSVGQEDHAPQLLAEHGTLAIHGIAMRPSSPAGMGQFRSQLVFLLPGNPVSCLCAYDFFAGRAIRAAGGRGREWPYRPITATLTRKLVSAVGRVDYARVKLHQHLGTGATTDVTAEPIAISGASLLTSTTQADGFVVIPPDSEGYAAQSVVSVFLYEQ
jgi:molybdopterin molybdotransferase